MLKGPKRSFVVLVVLLVVVVGVESSSKNVPNRTKIVQRKKKRAYVAHYGIELSLFLCVAVYGRVWVCMAVYGPVWSFLAVIDPNSFGLVSNTF